MAGDRVDTPVKGIAVLDSVWVPTRIHEADTAMTEADPQPGTASTTAEQARLVPQFVGVQSEAAVVVVTRSGNPGLGQPGRVLVPSAASLDNALGACRTAEIGYYPDDGTETEDDLRGYEQPTKLTDWRAPGTLNQPDRCDAAVFSLSGKVALRWDCAANRRFAVWNPYTDSFENVQSLPSQMDLPASIVCVPGTERLLHITPFSTQYTDDYGATWSTYSRFGPGSVEDNTGSPDYSGKIRSGFDGQGNLLWMATNLDTDDVDMYASTDLGVTWSWVESVPEAFIGDWDLASHPDGSLFVAYVDASTHAKVARLGGAFSLLTTASPVTVFPDAYSAGEFGAQRVWLGIDYNGAIWVYSESVTFDGSWRMAVSTDVGAVFNELLGNVTSRTPYLFNHLGITDGAGGWRLQPNAAGGFIAAACFGVVGTGTEQGGMAKLGGWTSPMPGTLTFGKYAVDLGAPGIDAIDRQWYGYARPEDVSGTAWTKTGTATTTHSSSDGTPISPLGYVKIDSAAGALEGRYDAQLTEFGAGTCVGHFAVAVADDGGSTQAIGVIWDMNDSAGNLSARIALYLTETGFRLRDLDASTWFGAEVAYTLTERTWFSVIIAPATDTIDILYRHDGDVKWRRQTYDAVSFSSATATNTADVQWGHTAAGATNAVSRWWLSQHEATLAGAEQPPDSDDAPLVGVDVYGASAGIDQGYPIPELWDTVRERPCFLLLRGGVGLEGETYSHDLAPGYPRTALFPSLDPSPSRRWRSLDVGVTEQVAIDRGYDSRPDGQQTLLLVVIAANARLWRLEYKEDGGGSYTALGTLDLAEGFESVGFARYGEVVVPSSGGAGSRYMHAGETAGGHIILDIGGAPLAVRIKTNTPGFFDSTASGPRATIILENGFDASTAPDSGLATICWPSGVMAVHGVGNEGSYRRYWRVSCLSTNESPEGYYEAGVVGLFALKPTGKQCGNGWEWSHEPNVTLSRDSYGTERREQLGPERRILTQSWDHGFKMDRVRGQDDADYVGYSGGAPLVARDDVWQVLVDVWRQAEGGSLPCIALLTEIADGATLTDPTLWLYCYLSGALRAQHATGTEGVAEFMRAGPVRLEEIV